MTRYPNLLRNLVLLACTLLTLLMDAWRFLHLCLRPSPTLAAENLFLRKQLALCQERQVKPRRPTQATRMALVWLARWFDWRQALVISFAIFHPLSGTPPMSVPRQHRLGKMCHETSKHFFRRILPWTPFWPRHLASLS
jgi:hypothetical protein